MDKVQHILVIRFSSIGDILLTTPVLRSIKSKYGNNCVLHYATKKEMLKWIDNNPYVDYFHALEKGQSVSSFVKKIKSEHKIDAIVDLHSNLRTFIIKLNFICIPKASFPKLNIRKWIYVNFKWDVMPKVHVVDRYFEAVRFLGVENDGKGLDYFLPKEAEEKALAILKEKGIHSYTAITIAAKFATKALPVEKFEELLNQIKGNVILLGGPEDLQKAEAIMKLVYNRTDVYNLVGVLSPSESAAMIKHANKVVAHDTGLMHMAAAFKKDMTVIWGNTTLALGMGPYLPSGVKSATYKEVQDLSCRPCSKIGYKKCPKGHFACMMNQDFSDLAE